MIYDCENGIEACTRGQRRDKIHGDSLERKGESPSRYPIGKGPVGACESFVLLARCAALNIVRNP